LPMSRPLPRSVPPLAPHVSGLGRTYRPPSNRHLAYVDDSEDLPTWQGFRNANNDKET
jgi:hypothetical protein